MQIGGYALSDGTGRRRFFSQYKRCNQLQLACVSLKRGWQHGRSLRDQREYACKANCRYKKEMYDKPGSVSALGNHFINRRGILHLRRLFLRPTQPVSTEVGALEEDR